MDVPFLGAVPLDIEIRINSDKGQPNQIFLKGNNKATYFDEISNNIINFIESSNNKEANVPDIKFE